MKAGCSIFSKIVHDWSKIEVWPGNWPIREHSILIRHGTTSGDFSNINMDPNLGSFWSKSLFCSHQRGSECVDWILNGLADLSASDIGVRRLEEDECLICRVWISGDLSCRSCQLFERVCTPSLFRQNSRCQRWILGSLWSNQWLSFRCVSLLLTEH